MRQIWISKAGPPEVLVAKEAPDPQPAAGETRIRVEASGVTSWATSACRDTRLLDGSTELLGSRPQIRARRIRAKPRRRAVRDGSRAGRYRARGTCKDTFFIHSA
jgi:hypothetical protein